MLLLQHAIPAAAAASFSAAAAVTGRSPPSRSSAADVESACSAFFSVSDYAHNGRSSLVVTIFPTKIKIKNKK